MNRTGPQFPRKAVTLPPDPVIGAAHLRDALGVSRAVLWRWRRLYRFPAAHRDGRDTFTLTDHVAHWLRAQGAEVRRSE